MYYYSKTTSTKRIMCVNKAFGKLMVPKVSLVRLSEEDIKLYMK